MRWNFLGLKRKTLVGENCFAHCSLLKVKADGSVKVHEQRVIKGNIQPAKEITIQAEDFVEPFHLENDFRIDFKGESLRIVIGLVKY